MFAKIRHNKRISNTLRYHEQKERQRLAECLTAVNFVKDLEYLTHRDKLDHFHRLTSLHESITNNGIHISLNFHPVDRLSNDDMVRLSQRYMQRIKFEYQPYLIYRHYDRQHPHVHIVTTNIAADGQRLQLTKSDYYHSLNLTRDLEKEYRLVQSGEWKRQKHAIGHALRVKYDEMTTMTALNNVLEKVIPQYRYTSVDELNAVLRLYNVEAYQGREESRLHHHRGLVYRILDDTGKPIATPVKASLFDSKPTLPHLEQKFTQNLVDTQRQQHRQRLTTMLEWNMTKKGMDLPSLQKILERQRINIVHTKDNVLYVDHETKAVFDGRQLGERYDHQALQQRLVPVQEQVQKQVLKHHQRHHHTIMHDL